MRWFVVLILLSIGGSPAIASECRTPARGWLLCEDFELAHLGWREWFAQSGFVQCKGCDADGMNNPARLRLDDTQAFDGKWSLHMPAEASANYQGAELAFRSCADARAPGCQLRGYDQLYFRAWVKLAADHQYVHHFMRMGGSRPDRYWEAEGNAGCRPNGIRHAGTTLDFNRRHELFFYTYFPEMRCDTTAAPYCAARQPGHCEDCAARDLPCREGGECCWGKHFYTEPRPVLPKDEWVCLEMMMQLNTPGEADGAMAYWMNDQLGHRQTGMHWRDIPQLQLNAVWVMHYIAEGDAKHANRIWWDNIVISQNRIGCGTQPE